MLKKIISLFLVVIAIFTIIFFFHRNDKVNLQSLRQPQTRTAEDLAKEVKESEADSMEDLALNEMINKMSIDEKIGQLIFAGIRGTTITRETEMLINEFKVGGIILFGNNLDSPEQSIQLLNQIKSINEGNILPIFLGVDQEGGRVERLPRVTNLPTNQEIGTRDNEVFSYEIGKLLGKELSAFGFNLNFAPVLDINSNPNNPVIGDRSFSHDPEVVSELGVQTIQGMKTEHIIPVVKHFPGHGDTNVDSHFELPLVNKSLAELETLELIPFKKAIEAGVNVIMTAHILLPQIDDKFPASMSEPVITGILREQLGFNGVVITDDLTMQAISDNFNIGDAAIESVKAGTDIILMAHDYDRLIAVYEALREAVHDGEITEERINESIQRIINLKWEYGLEDKQVEVINVEELNELIDTVL